MKKTIRDNVWETNSSSMHAIAIAHDYKIPWASGTIWFHRRDFGWVPEEFPFLEDRVSYLYEAILGFYEEPFKQQWLDWVDDVLTKRNISVIFIDKNSEYSGYIDHVEECDEFLNYVLESEDHLLAFIFGDSAICTDNDNHDDHELYNEFCKYYKNKTDQYTLIYK